MSEPLPPDASHPAGDTEEVDAVVVTPAAAQVPVRPPLRTLAAWQPVRALAPAVQAAAVAAGSFVAGAAAVGLVQRRRHRRELVRTGSPLRLGRRPSRRSGRGGSKRGAGELVQIVSSRSLLVDVHLLGERR